MIIPEPPPYVLYAQKVAQDAKLKPFLPSFEVWARERHIATLKALLAREGA